MELVTDIILFLVWLASMAMSIWFILIIFVPAVQAVLRKLRR